MKLACIKISKENNEEIVIIDLLNEVYYVDKQKNSLVFHTVQGELYQVVTLNYAEKWLSDLGFIRLDRFSIVNKNLIRGIDGTNMKVIFDNGKMTSISEDGLKHAISDPILKRLINNL